MEQFREEDSLQEKYQMENVPQTIKQMGGVDGEIRIYMEDYVYTYLYHFGRSKGATEKIAALVGRYMEEDGEIVCIISGAVQGCDAAQSRGIEGFSDETWNHIYEQMDLYFPKTELLGWVHIQNGFGSFLMEKDENFHLDCFKENWHLFYVMDVVDRVDTFYVYGKETMLLRPAKGYFIYYDKNEDMQEYMLGNPINKPKVEMEEWEGKTDEMTAFIQRDMDEKHITEERIDAAKKIRSVLQNRKKIVKREKKNRYATMATASCILSGISLCLGLSLVNSTSRLQELEGEISVVQSAYLAMESQVEKTMLQAQEEATAVFSTDTESLSEILAETETKTMEKEAVGVWHMISFGENLTTLSEKYYGNNQWVDSIMAANGLENPDKIYAGQEIWIP